MLSTFVSTAIILLTASGTFAAPQATPTGASLVPYCSVTYGPFRLTAKIVDTGIKYPVRLLPETTSTAAGVNVTSSMIVDTNSTCTNCGVIPSYWDLKAGVLIPVDSSAPRGVSTINKAVPRGSDLEFITSRTTQPSYPIYCSQYTGVNTPPILSVHGSSALFTMCAFTSMYPPPTIFSVVYNRFDVQPVGESCYPVKLVLDYIGVQ